MGILSPNVWLFPVISMVTGQERVFLHDSSGKSVCGIKSVTTARCHRGGNCKSGSDSSSRVRVQFAPSPIVELSDDLGPHLSSPSSASAPNTLSIKTWMRRSNKQRSNGDRTNRTFVFIFRLCKWKT